MNVTELLASSLNRRDEEPNESLAAEIATTKRADWVKELVDNLASKDKNMQSDCIKVLYEIGERGSAELIAPYASTFCELLKSKNNRLVWGAMTAIDTFTLLAPKEIYDSLSDVMAATDKGSTITIDHAVNILAKLSSIEKYAGDAFPLLIEQLKKCPFKQLPMYAERSAEFIAPKDLSEFVDLIETRLPEMEKESQKQRLRKVLKKLSKATQK